MLRPIVRFFLLGALCFLADQAWQSRVASGADGEIRLAADEVEKLRSGWRALHAAPPSDRELRGLVDRAIDQEVLHREALRLGLHRVDPVVRTRLVQNMRFVTDAPDRDDESLFREALALELERTDVVVRLRLIERMRAVLASVAAEPTQAESRAFVRRHPAWFSSSDKFRLSYRFVPAGQAPGSPAGEVRSGLFTEKRLVRSFGAALAGALVQLPQGHWSGPLERGDGRLLARLDEVIPGEPIPFAQVEDRARQALLRERRARAVADGLSALRSRYALRVELAKGV